MAVAGLGEGDEMEGGGGGVDCTVAPVVLNIVASATLPAKGIRVSTLLLVIDLLIVR